MTPKLDKISVEFSNRIADPVASATTAGKILTVAERTSFVNKGLHALFNEGWNQVQGNKKEFIKLFPELLEDDTIQTANDGTYSISATKIRDFYCAISGLKLSTLITVLSKELFTIVKSGRYEDYVPTSADPVMFDIQNTLSFFPEADFHEQNVTVYYIKLPLNPTDGSFFTQGGTYDSPFADKWNSKIADLAEQIYKAETQET